MINHAINKHMTSYVADDSQVRSSHSSNPPSWICDDVILPHPAVDFRGPNTVLIFHIDRCKPHIWSTDDDSQTDIVIP